MRNCTIGVLAALVVVGHGTHGFSAADPLQEFGKDFVGRWVGESTLPADMPPQGKKGEKVAGHARARLILDGKAVECDWHVGGLSAKWVAVRDANAKQIRVYGVSSDGELWVSRMSKKGNVWIWSSTGVNGDGERLSAIEEMTISNDGNTHTYRFTKRRQGDEELPEFTATWNRVNK